MQCVIGSGIAITMTTWLKGDSAFRIALCEVIGFLDGEITEVSDRR